MEGDRTYQEAMHRFLSKQPREINREGKRYPSRDELHDRDRFR
jgi:hypothetical protein